MIQTLLSQTHKLAAAAEETKGIEALGLDPIAIVVQSITFLLLFFIIQKFALKKIVSTLEERRKTINRGLHLTAEMDKLKSELDLRVEAALKEARLEADKIISEAHTESGEMLKAAEDSANRKTEAILKDAEAKIERDILAAKKDLKNEVVDLAIGVTTQILREKVSSSEDRKLTEKYLKEVL